MKEKKTEKRKWHLFSKILVILFGVYVIWAILWALCHGHIIPYTKTNFKSYEAFREMTHNFYPDEQPASATEIKYYYYDGAFDDFSAVAFTVDAQDFASLSQWYTEYFQQFEDSSGDGYVRYENQALPENFIQDKNLDLLSDMIDGNISDYKIVEYTGSGNSETKTMLGAIGNESTGQFIIFFGKDAFPE